MNKRFFLNAAAAILLTSSLVHAEDAMTGVDLGTVTVRGRVEMGTVVVDGSGSSARISGVYLGDGTKLDNADIDRYIHLDDVQVSNGGILEAGIISLGPGTDIGQLDVHSSLQVGRSEVDGGGYLSMGSLELDGVHADHLTYSEEIEADSVTVTGGGSAITGGIHRYDGR